MRTTIRRAARRGLLAACAACGGDSRTAPTPPPPTRRPAGPRQRPDGRRPDARRRRRAGVPAGYVGRTDRRRRPSADAKYVARGGGAWEVTTGPAHVLWAAGDTASGRYTARARFTQLEAPSHPEAFGIVVRARPGGRGAALHLLRRARHRRVPGARARGRRHPRRARVDRGAGVPKQDGSGAGDLRPRGARGPGLDALPRRRDAGVRGGRGAVPTDGVAGSA
jgi:hypothetical protein